MIKIYVWNQEQTSYMELATGSGRCLEVWTCAIRQRYKRTLS